MLSNVRYPNCTRVIGPHWFFGTFFFVVILLVAGITTFIVLARFGIYAAILWFSFPIGAISYLKARFAPLQVKEPKLGPGDYQ